jgi:hypothetical protein
LRGAAAADAKTVPFFRGDDFQMNPALASVDPKFKLNPETKR